MSTFGLIFTVHTFLACENRPIFPLKGRAFTLFSYKLGVLLKQMMGGGYFKFKLYPHPQIFSAPLVVCLNVSMRVVLLCPENPICTSAEFIQLYPDLPKVKREHCPLSKGPLAKVAQRTSHI